MADATIRLGFKDQTWFDDNGDFQLDPGQQVHLIDGSGLQTGQYKMGDENGTILSVLEWLGTGGTGSASFSTISGDPRDNPPLAAYLDAKANLQSTLLTGGTISIVSSTTIRVAASTYYILSSGSYSAIQTDFAGTVLAASGTQRYVGLYGNTSGVIVKVEGTEAALATFPTAPANTALIGYVLVTDAAVSTTPDLSGYLLKSSKATAADYAAATDDTKYLTPYSARFRTSNTETLTNKRITKRRVVVTQSATPTINTDNTDIASITGLAQAITSFTTNLSGTPVAGDMMMIQITDNGTARAITWGASFQSTSGATLPTTTVISTMLRVLLQWNSVASKWDCIGVC